MLALVADVGLLVAEAGAVHGDFVEEAADGAVVEEDGELHSDDVQWGRLSPLVRQPVVAALHVWQVVQGHQDEVGVVGNEEVGGVRAGAVEEPRDEAGHDVGKGPLAVEHTLAADT